MGILRKIVSGAAWNTLSQLGRQVISLATIMVLARLLRPEDFGLVAMSYVVKTLAYIFASMGIGSAIIQKKEIDEGYLSTAYWASVTSGIVIALIVSICSPLVARFFHRQELTAIIIVTSSIFVFGGVSATHRDYLERNMRFKQIAIIDFFGNCAGSVAAIAMAVQGMGYWSLVIQEIAATAFKVPLFWKMSKWHPKFIFHREKFKDLFGFSVYVLMSNLLNFFNRNGDNIIIGRFLGATQLGFYDLAYSLMLKPLQYISHTTSRALFPALSKVQDDKKLVRKTYLQMVKIISLITFPMMTGLAIIARDIIMLIYGPKWESAIPVFTILCFVGAWQSVGTTVGTILLSQGRSSLAFKMAVTISPFIWGAFWLGTRWGITGVAACYAIVSGSWWLISHAIANRLINLKIFTFLKSLMPAIIYSLIMGIFIMFLHNKLIDETISLITRLITIISCGIFIYILLLFSSRDDEIYRFRSKLVNLLYGNR